MFNVKKRKYIKKGVISIMNENIFDSVQLLIRGTERNLGGGIVSSVVITGMVVVFIGLVLLILFVVAYGKIFEAIENTKAKKVKLSIEKDGAEDKVGFQSVVAPPTVEEGIEDEVVAVIAAAVSAMSAKAGKKMVLRSVKTAKSGRPVWANAGIMENTKPF